MRVTTTGRRSGQPRSVILAYLDDGPNLVTMAMNGWDPAEPGWWLNLQADPHATVQLTDGTRPVTARAATGAERPRLWELWRSVHRNLDAYARRRPGQTAVVVLEPAEAEQVQPGTDGTVGLIAARHHDHRKVGCTVTLHRRWLPEGFFGPVEYAARTRYRRPPGFYRRLQSIAPMFGRLGMTPSYVVELEVPGRRTGLPRRTLLVQVDHQGEHYLVALAGESEWVRNVRAAAGDVVLTHGNQRYDAHLTDVPVEQRAEVIRAYVHRPSPRGRDMVRAGEARHYFGIDPGAPLEQIATIAGHYPVFRVDPGGSSSTESHAPCAPKILRISPTDRAMLAMGSGSRVPEQIGILLVLASARSLDLARLRTVLEERTRSIPRLRRRLVRVPPGCGGPVWVDDPGFDIRRHVREVTVPDDAGDQHLYDTALAAVMTPLPWSGPPWAAILLTGMRGGQWTGHRHAPRPYRRTRRARPVGVDGRLRRSKG